MTRAQRQTKRQRFRAKCVKNILRCYARVSNIELQAGREWYDRAELLARTLAPNDYTRAAGVIAALSPRVTWSENVKGAIAIMRAANSGSVVCPSVAGVYQNVNKAWRIATGDYTGTIEDLLDYGNRDGNFKVGRFYRNITGDHTCVTVDVWAARVADPTCKDDSVRRLRYLDIESAFQESARRIGDLFLSPRDLQAACWVHIRGSAE